jgi:DNA-binding transcriptional MocR family regulator
MVRPDEIVITCGGLEALHCSLRAVARPGDTIAIESPAFYSCLQMLELLGMKALQIPTHPREGMDLHPLAEALGKQRVKACWVMTNFQNPLGSLMPEDKKKDLVGLLSRYDVPLIEDDVYEELYFTADKPKPAKAFDWKGLVLHCSSFSKALGPGHRVGWATAGRFAKRVHWIKLMSTLATNIVAQAAIADYLKHGGYDHYLRGLRRTLSTGRDHMLTAITRHFPPGTRFVQPEGGYFVWVELPEKVSALELHREAMEHGISLAPGPIFAPHKGYENFIRLNYGHAWTPRLEKGIATLGGLVRDKL